MRDRKLLPWNEIIGFVIWQIRFKKLALMICLKLQAKFFENSKNAPKEQRGPSFGRVQFFNNPSCSILRTCTYLPYFATTPCSTITIPGSLRTAPTIRAAGNILDACCRFFRENVSESVDPGSIYAPACAAFFFFLSVTCSVLSE